MDKLEDDNEIIRKQKETFENLLTAGIIGMFRGIDLDLYQQMMKEFEVFNDNVYGIMSSNKFNNTSLTVMKSFFEQGNKILDDVKNEMES